MFLLALSFGGECKKWGRPFILFKIDARFESQCLVCVQGLNCLHNCWSCCQQRSHVFSSEGSHDRVISASSKIEDQSMPFPFVVKLMDQSMARSKWQWCLFIDSKTTNLSKTKTKRELAVSILKIYRNVYFGKRACQICTHEPTMGDMHTLHTLVKPPQNCSKLRMINFNFNNTCTTFALVY